MLRVDPRSMITKAFAWAKANGKHRVNEVHGEEEIRILVNETFNFKKSDIEETTQRGALEVQEL